ncbi:ATPase [Aureococcus anophagefferens]|nr:ATPase [Aureococcus anophagefferens]
MEFPGTVNFPGSKPTGRKESRSALRPSRCFVKTRCGAIVREGPGFGSAMVAELPHRVVVTAVGVMENANGARVRISAPVNGWVSFKNVELYPKTSPEPVDEAADPEDQAQIDDDRRAAEEAVALARLAEEEGGFSDTESFDSDASSYEVVEEIAGPDFVDAAKFSGFRAGYFFTTRDGATGYFRDPEEFVKHKRKVPDAVDGARGEPYRSPEAPARVPEAARARRRRRRGRIAAREDLANLVNENPALMVTRDLQPYVEMLRTLLKERAGVDEAARLATRPTATTTTGGDWIRSEQFLVKQAGAVKEAEALAKTGSFVAIDATPPLAETWSMVRGPTRAEKEGERTCVAATPRWSRNRGAPRAKPWLSPEVLEAFRWMMQKVELRQDMFLVSEPGPRARGLVAAFCDLLGRVAEFVALTRDTCESDLKQRREIRDGALVWANQAPVEAALHGRVLVLEGVDKAERNVLPTSNNLIENREMALDDGTFLTSPERFDALARERAAAGATTEADAAAALEAEGLRRRRPSSSSPSACPCPTGQDKGDSTSLQRPRDPTAVRQLARLADALDGARDADADAAAERAGGRDAKAAATLARAYPHGLLFAPSSADRRLVDAAYQALGLKQTRLDARGLPVLDGLDGDALYRFATSASLDAGDGERRVVLRFETPSNSASRRHDAARRFEARRPKFAVDLTVKQQVVLSAMLRDHCAGIDVCLCGWRGVGKTALARCFADALGYRVRTIFCYKDMGARDFLQRRVTDDRGNTGWKDSALVDAALRGDVAVLDGVDRLPRGLLYATLARLVSDRELDLPDGTRLCAPRRWAELLHGGLSETDLRARGLRRVSPSFRVVAIAGSVPSGTRDDRRGQWLDPELASLFHFHVAPVFEPNDERKLMKRELGPAPDGDVVVDVLLSYNKSIRDHAYQRDKLAMEKKVAAPATSLALCALSLRQLLRAARTAALDHDPDDCIDKAAGRLRRYLDPADRDAVQRYANTACRQAGLPCVEGSVAINGARSAPGRTASSRSWRSVRAARRPRDYAERRGVEHLVLGDVAAPTRAPARPELVPDPLFVPIHSHMWLLRDALLDWRAGHHLLFIGNQGVGKNKIADELLHLLRSLGGHAAEADDDTLWIDDAFRMIVLANRPGRPFQGNDFYRECGDAFASFGVDNPEVRSEVAMLKAYAPAVPDALVCEHLNAFADDGVDAALADVFAFDAHVPPLKVTLDNALKQDGFVMCGAMREDDDENFAADEKSALRKRREAGVDLTKLALDVDESAVVVADARGGSVAAAKRRGDAALKLALKHDMFLIGDPGPRPRVLQFCELLGRECEFVALTRDTSEGDLKQRREIRDGAAERNVLPLLNNLLENREMALDDGTFLMDAKRFDALCAEDAERASGLVDGDAGWADAVPDWRADQVMREQPTAARPWAPDGAVESTAALLAAFPRLPPAGAEARCSTSSNL